MTQGGGGEWVLSQGPRSAAHTGGREPALLTPRCAHGASSQTSVMGLVWGLREVSGGVRHRAWEVARVPAGGSSPEGSVALKKRREAPWPWFAGRVVRRARGQSWTGGSGPSPGCLLGGPRTPLGSARSGFSRAFGLLSAGCMGGCERKPWQEWLSWSQARGLGRSGRDSSAPLPSGPRVPGGGRRVAPVGCSACSAHWPLSPLDASLMRQPATSPGTGWGRGPNRAGRGPEAAAPGVTRWRS